MRCSSGMFNSGAILLYTVLSMKPRKESLSSFGTHSPSSVRYSSMLKNQQSFNETFLSFTRRTKIG